MITPILKDDALLEDIRTAPSDPGRFHLWWLGQSGFLIKWQDHHLLLDPYLSDSLTKKYAATDKPHERLTELVIDPAKLDMIDVVTSSHTHTDHLDPETLLPLVEANPRIKLVLPQANLDEARKRLSGTRIETVGLDDGSLASVDAFLITGIAAAHNEVGRDVEGHCRFLGYVIRFGPFSIYHSGDTIWHETLARSLSRFRYDAMILPINGNKPERKVAGNFSGVEAAALAWACGARTVIPCHYDMFEFNTEDPAEFVFACEQLKRPCKVLHCGERWTCQRA